MIVETSFKAIILMAKSNCCPIPPAPTTPKIIDVLSAHSHLNKIYEIRSLEQLGNIPYRKAVNLLAPL